MMKLFVGIDVSSKNLEVSMLTSDISAKPLFQGTFENDLNGATEVKKLILKLNLSQQFEKIVIGMEATSIYSFHPAYFFENDDDLAQFNTQAVIINPRDTKKYKDIFEIQKNDSIDAYYIADFLRLERYSTSLVRQEKYVALQRLTRSRFELVKSLSRSKQHFLENLYYKLNKLVVNDDLNTSVFGATMLDLLTEDFTTDDISVMPIEELADYLNSKGKGRFANPSALAKTIQKAIRGSYRLDKAIQTSIDVVLSVYVNEIRLFQKQIKLLEKSNDDLLKTFDEAQILQSIPGIGPVYSAGILAEIGQIKRFENQSQLAKYAGLAWKKYQSGSFNGDNTPMIHSGDTYLRYYLIEAANSVRRYDPVFARYYHQKANEAKHSPHKRAVSLTARKLVRVIDVLLRNHQIYQKEKVV